MKNSLIIILSAILLLSANSISAQNYKVSTQIQNDSIIVGEQTNIKIEIASDSKLNVFFPEFKDTICDKIYLINDIDTQINNTFTKNYTITAFDTGINIIAPIKFWVIDNADTIENYSDELALLVKPYVLIDTIPRDTIYANIAGFVLFGKDGFEKEIEQYLPDSVKQTMPADSLEMLRNEIKRQLTQQYASQIMQIGFTNQEQIDSVVNAKSHTLFIVNKDIEESFFIYGNVDTVFVQEGAKVEKGTALFTLIRINDIDENLYNTPFNFAEFMYLLKKFFAKFWWLILLIIILGVAGYILFCKLTNRKLPQIIKPKPKIPAHIIALKELERIRNEKIWSRGQVKEYHVQLTGTIRAYIFNRYAIDAEQMTTAETLDAVRGAGHVSDENIAQLRQMLELADFVKFAKYQSLQGDNDLSLRNAFDFVESTKETIPSEDPNKENLDKEAQNE